MISVVTVRTCSTYLSCKLNNTTDVISTRISFETVVRQRSCYYNISLAKFHSMRWSCFVWNVSNTTTYIILLLRIPAVCHSLSLLSLTYSYIKFMINITHCLDSLFTKLINIVRDICKWYLQFRLIHCIFLVLLTFLPSFVMGKSSNSTHSTSKWTNIVTWNDRPLTPYSKSSFIRSGCLMCQVSIKKPSECHIWSISSDY